MTIRTIEAAMAFIHDRSGYDRGFISNPFAGDDAARLGLKRTAAALERLGNPHHQYPIVHIAGSKGKGSTASFTDSILRALGLRCGRFLSPHLHTFRERFAVDNVIVPEADFTSLVADVRDAVVAVEASRPELGQTTAWEISTALALLWFARAACDVAVIEVGLGGTLDATNVVTPAVSVITRLDYEHTAILGSSMREIAGNKAGIIKPNAPVVSADQPADGMAVIKERARDTNATLQVANRDWRTTGTEDAFSITGPGWEHVDLKSSLVGPHQLENASLAIAAIHALAAADTLPAPVIDEAIRTGLATTFIPGRFEIVRIQGRTVVIDGAHTPASMAALAQAVQAHFPGAPVTVIVGMLRDKDPDLVLPALDPIASAWIAAPVASPRSLAPARIAASVRKHGAPVTTAGSVAEALSSALDPAANPAPDDVILVTGSLGTAAEARVALGLA